MSSSRRDLARRISDEIERPRRRSAAHPRPQVIGVTGPPGAGKSTLVDQMIGVLRGQGKRPGVVVVDPSSSITGGALLGDRIRMQRHASDEGVFIRSVATRGQLGGLAAGVEGVLDLLAGEGFAPLVIETVGVGQSEVEVAGVADTVVLVLYPGWGDDVQVAKAGLVEIADVFFINKADQGDVASTVAQTEAMLSLGQGEWRPPVLFGSALNGEGVEELLEAIATHQRATTPLALPPGERP